MQIEKEPETAWHKDCLEWAVYLVYVSTTSFNCLPGKPLLWAGQSCLNLCCSHASHFHSFPDTVRYVQGQLYVPIHTTGDHASWLGALVVLSP